MRSVADTDSVRRQNRGLVLGALRREGPMSRTQLATVTGLSPASITAIGSDMIGQGLLSDLSDAEGVIKGRGRPAIRLGFNRAAGHALIIELDIYQLRVSLVDYSGNILDRIETPITPALFTGTSPSEFLTARIEQIQARNAEISKSLMRIAISVQGILDRTSTGLNWSPVTGLAGADIASSLRTRFEVPVLIRKRGSLLAEGTRLLFPELRDASIATVFVGSTVAMGISGQGQGLGRGGGGATEFGHMNHVPDGALCRCGMRGCLEAYAADYGVLRTAYTVPEKTSPAKHIPAEEYGRLISSARRGSRNALHAFNIAGHAIGYGLSRLMSVFEPSHIVLTGPGAAAFDLMLPEMRAAMEHSLVCSIDGIPEIMAQYDEREPIFQGLAYVTLHDIDQNEFAALPSTGLRA